MGTADNADLKALEDFCVDNPDLEALEQLLGEFNIFEAAGLTDQETKHSRFLGFLLDPHNPHGLGTKFLTRILQAAAKSAPETGSGVTALDLELMDMSDAAVACETDNIDIEVQSPANKFVVVIENKIKARQHSDQLDKYHRRTKVKFPGWRVLFVLLSKAGQEQDRDGRYLTLSYDTVAEITRSVAESAMGPEVALAMKHYEKLLRRHVVSDAIQDELCQRIISKHRKALTILAKQMGDPAKQAVATIEAIMCEQGFEVKKGFLVPQSWVDWMPAGSTRPWLVSFWVENSVRASAIQLEIGPTDDKALRAAMVSAAKTYGKPFRKFGTSKDVFTRILRLSLSNTKFEDAEDVDQWRDAVKERLKSFVTAALPIVTKVLQDAVVGHQPAGDVREAYFTDIPPSRSVNSSTRR
ncbi:MAG: PD-(D/E)XK nuclease family protein [Fimbriimonadaceae bacterium]|nr:PD-(D/E)XK nuclease family protein [Fimbriimonadaceae bacterium]